ncbi:hypothetical protein Glove_53g83 [Diversispora epigaea]|uniref:Tryptophan--tRNA ligase, mitochondrial n=1 Tax=Diversispora epigaea TaxID=1348612 RepID=A0A397JMQ0_9GLOM|nr:hypothetical protein Glove_53g83 [Diversispora epigaea]
MGPLKLILSGIQPTGIPHIGNFLGALSNWASLQHTANVNDNLLYAIVDLHALTVPQDPRQLRKNKLDMTIALLACGIDPKRSIIFEQSKIPAHSECAWILSCITPVGWLSRMTQWKVKSQQNKKIQSVEDIDSTSGSCLGLFAYPVLQAADILLYKATHIPIGEDNIQHLELTRDIALKINKLYKKDIFPIPQSILAPAKRVMSLRDSSKKMSKSDPSELSRINLDDTPSEIISKIKKATTDSIKGITYDPVERPAIANLITIYAAIKEVAIEEIVKEYSNSNAQQFKEALAQVLIEKLTPVRNEIEKLKIDSDYVQQVLKDGNEKASLLANKNLDELYNLCGLK